MSKTRCAQLVIVVCAVLFLVGMAQAGQRVTVEPSGMPAIAHRTAVTSSDTYTYQPGDVNPIFISTQKMTTFVDTHDSVTLIIQPWFAMAVSGGTSTDYGKGDTIAVTGPTFIDTEINGRLWVVWKVTSITSAIGSDTTADIYVQEG